MNSVTILILGIFFLGVFLVCFEDMLKYRKEMMRMKIEIEKIRKEKEEK